MTITNHTTWSRYVKKRDKCCQSCGNAENLIAHHVKSWRDNPEIRFDLDNGITFCKKCHFDKHKKKVSPVKPQRQYTPVTSRTDTSLVGQKINKWKILEKLRSGKIYYFYCECRCGNFKYITETSIKTGTSTNCGCTRREKMKSRTGNKNSAYKHGLAKRGKVEREYKLWAGIKTRYFNDESRPYPYYGGRGITMYDRWKNSYENFIADMGYAPTNKHEVDRVNVNGNYEPSNCRWATRKEQCNNTRSNKFITFNGMTKTYSQWDEYLGLRRSTVGQRKRWGWDDADCLSPVEENQ